MILRAVGLCKTHKSKSVVQNFSVSLIQGEIVSFLGPIQAGKNSSLLLISGLIKEDKGDIYLDGQRITHMSKSQRAQSGIYYVPQQPDLNHRLTVEENIMLALKHKASDRNVKRQNVEALMKEFGLSSLRKMKSKALSGGQRRKTELACILGQNPKFMLMNEPFSGVPPEDIDDIKSTILRLKEKNIGIIMTDHDLELVLSVTDRAYFMFSGRQFHFQPTLVPLFNEKN